MAIKSHWQSYINGKWVDSVSGGTIDVEDPATGEKIAEIARADVEDVDRAVMAARECFESRALINMRPINRARMLIDVARELRRRQDEIAEVICYESGMGMVDSVDQVDCTAQYFEYYGGLADKIEGAYIPLGAGYVDYTVPEPHGVSAHIIPWNFPIELVGRGVAPALAAGNTVVIKSPELDPLHNTFLGEICSEVGFLTAPSISSPATATIAGRRFASIPRLISSCLPGRCQRDARFWTARRGASFRLSSSLAANQRVS